MKGEPDSVVLGISMGHGDGDDQDIVAIDVGQDGTDNRRRATNTVTARRCPTRDGYIPATSIRGYPPESAKGSLVDDRQYIVPAFVDDALITIDAGCWTGGRTSITNGTGAGGKRRRYARLSLWTDIDVDDRISRIGFLGKLGR